MKLTTKQKTFLSVLSVAIGAAILLIALEYTPKIGGKIFLAIIVFMIVNWVNDLIKHNQSN
jgi:nitrate/nitrite transporter NarK